MTITNKDTKRINDIVKKANGSIEKAVKLATTMANRITNPIKATTRYMAANTILGHYHPVTAIFANRNSFING